MITETQHLTRNDKRLLLAGFAFGATVIGVALHMTNVPDRSPETEIANADGLSSFYETISKYSARELASEEHMFVALYSVSAFRRAKLPLPQNLKEFASSSYTTDAIIRSIEKSTPDVMQSYCEGFAEVYKSVSNADQNRLRSYLITLRNYAADRILTAPQKKHLSHVWAESVVGISQALGDYRFPAKAVVNLLIQDGYDPSLLRESGLPVDRAPLPSSEGSVVS